ncbi:hypothetical protein DOY81_014569, partial [Sarcophaga bullata]
MPILLTKLFTSLVEKQFMNITELILPNIQNSTIITLKALPTCLEYTDCASCVNHATAF